MVAGFVHDRTDIRQYAGMAMKPMKHLIYADSALQRVPVHRSVSYVVHTRKTQIQTASKRFHFTSVLLSSQLHIQYFLAGKS